MKAQAGYEKPDSSINKVPHVYLRLVLQRPGPGGHRPFYGGLPTAWTPVIFPGVGLCLLRPGPGGDAASDRFLAAVRDRGVPLVTESSGALRGRIKARGPALAAVRDAFDGQVIARLQGFAAEVAVLAGYMLIASPRLCRALLCLNLHPAVPGGPKGTWQQVMWQVMAAGHPGGRGHDASGHPGVGRGPPGGVLPLVP